MKTPKSQIDNNYSNSHKNPEVVLGNNQPPQVNNIRLPDSLKYKEGIDEQIITTNSNLSQYLDQAHFRNYITY